MSLPGAFFPQLFVGEHITCQLNLNMIKVFDIKPLDSVITFLANHHVCVWCFFLVIPQCFFSCQLHPQFLRCLYQWNSHPVFFAGESPMFFWVTASMVFLSLLFSQWYGCVWLIHRKTPVQSSRLKTLSVHIQMAITGVPPPLASICTILSHYIDHNDYNLLTSHA